MDDSNNASPWLALLVGGLIVAVGVIVYFFYAERPQAPPGPTVNLEVKVPRPADLPQGPTLPPPPIPVPK